MANHSSTHHSSGKKDKPKYNAADAWIQEQSKEGPWDGVDGVNASQWNNPGYGSYQHPASVAATQGSAKHPRKKDHKSSGKK